LVIGFSVVDDLMIDLISTLIYIFVGTGMVPFLTLFRVLELPEKHVLNWPSAIMVALLSFIGGFSWILITNDRKVKILPINIIRGTLVLSYIGLPLLHLLFVTTNRIPYITASSNFFAEDILLRISTWILFILLVFLADKLSPITISRQNPEQES
jgi:hypothetical protein